MKLLYLHRFISHNITFLILFLSEKEYQLANYFYSTQSFLSWTFNHYFFNAIHWTYVGNPFYPYRAPNPPSSNPLRKYQNLYEEWMDQDNFGYSVNSLRMNIRNGVDANINNLPSGLDARLKQICDQIDVVFFYPVVYRTDIDTIFPAARLDNTQGSAVSGSNEYLIRDLQEQEFDILFFDYKDDPDIMALSNSPMSSTDALQLLERRCPHV